jgi:nucleoside-diphosphate-sugar epimerase
MKVLVTGGTGVVGQAAVTQILAGGARELQATVEPKEIRPGRSG